MKDRIQQIIDSAQLTSAKFADKIGVQRSSISHILSGRNKPSLDFVQKVLAAFENINTDWLLFGKGEMQNNSNKNNQKVNSGTEKIGEEQGTKHNVQPPQPEEPHSAKQPFFPSSDKQIERIVIFYKDKSFSEYFPQ